MKPNTAILLVLGLTLSLTSVIRAADQPKPGPEHKKLEIILGEWTYEGIGETTPFLAAAGKFKGKFANRMVLGGFFVQNQGEDTSDNQYVYQSVSLTGYDTEKKAYFSHSFENDGTVNVSSISISGNTWTTLGTRTHQGKVYKMKSTEVYAADGKSSKSVTEYSADNGKTWNKAWASTATKVGS